MTSSREDIQERVVAQPQTVHCFWVENETITIREARDYYNPNHRICQECRACQR